jgi:uncharacterized protein
MILEGVVSNVANFGAFVDVGVHQDGLVHISALANGFVKDPRDVVKAGDIVKVKVIEVDVERKRIAFTMRLDDEARGKSKENSRAPSSKTKHADKSHDGQSKRSSQQRSTQRSQRASQPANAAMGNAFADAFAKAKKS